MSLQAILTEVARLAGRKPPRVKLPHGAVMPVAAVAESWARLFGGEPLATRDGIRMARKKMYFSSAKAKAALGYAPRPSVAWTGGRLHANMVAPGVAERTA